MQPKADLTKPRAPKPETYTNLPEATTAVLLTSTASALTLVLGGGAKLQSRSPRPS